MKRAPVTAACAALSCFLAAPALAAPRGEDTPLRLEDQTQAAAGGGGTLVRTFVGLAIVIGVIYGLYWVLKQVKSSREEKASGSGLSSLATLPLGPNRSIYVVRAGNEILVVGATEHGITPLRAYPEEEARIAGLLEEAPAVVEERRANPLLDQLRALTVRR